MYAELDFDTRMILRTDCVLTNLPSFNRHLILNDMTRKSSRHIVLGMSLVLLGGCAAIERSPSPQHEADAPKQGQEKGPDVQAQVQDLRAQLSAANARVEALETRLSSLGDKLDTLNAPKKKNVVAVVPSPADQAGEEVSPDVPSTDRESGFKSDLAVVNYRKAYILYQAKKYADAILAFSSFLERYADHPFAGSAQFYIGDSYLAQGEPKLALQEFQRVLTAYDRSAHIPETLEKMAQAEDRLKNRESGAKYRQLLVTLFPMSPAAAALGAASSTPSTSESANETVGATSPAPSTPHLVKPEAKTATNKSATSSANKAAAEAPSHSPIQSPIQSPISDAPSANDTPATAPLPPSAPAETESVSE